MTPPTTVTPPTQYDIHPEDRRLLMLSEIDADAGSPKINNVVRNWFEKLKRVVPARR